MHGLIQFAIRWRLFLASFGIVTLIAAYPLSTRLETERSIASLFGEDDPTLADYRAMKQWFGRDDVLVLMYRDANLATREGIKRSQELTEQVRSLDGVTATLSPWVLNEAAEGMNPPSVLPFGFGRSPSKSKTPKLMRPDDAVGEGLSEIFAGYTHSDDYTHAAVVAMIRQEDDGATVDAMKRIAAEWEQHDSVDRVSLVGEPVLIDEAFSLVRRDGARLALYTVGLLSLVVALSLWDLRLILMMMLVIGWSVVMTKATMYSLGIPLSLIASILTAIVTVVAVTAVLHLGVRYHRRRGRGFDRFEATSEVMRRMAGPIFWTCATDAAGFAALWFSGILPVRQFGLMVALAALSVFVGLLIFTPTCLMIPDLFGAGGASRGRRRMTRALHRLCVRVAMLFISRTKSTIAFALLLIATSVAVVANSETETSFLRNFRPGSSIVVDYGNVEKNLGGAGVWDLVLDVPTVLSNGFLEKVQLLEADLIEQLGDQGLSKAISIADATEVLGRSRAGKWMPASMRIEAMRTRLPTFIGALISEPLAESPDRRKLRVMLRSPEGLRADRKRALIAGVNKIANEHVQRWDESRAKNDSSTADATQRQADKVLTTGYYVIMTRLVDQLVSDQWRCFAAAAGLIWILMSLATRSVRLATAALVPNLLPAFLVLGFVSLSGGRINMGAAMIAAVSIGLSIDGSVHLLTVYLRRRSLGRGVGTSAVSAAGNIGAPVLLATLALVAGFSVLSTSEFVPTATFGTLVAWTLVIGTMVNLSVLPALIRGIEPDSGRHDRGE